jgi:tRNA/tmRNA/rRNA uracil-C5-methylase (TrmA/RlmC/RlmD family)
MSVAPRKFNPTPFAYHEEITLRIDTLTNEGSGLGRINDWVVFVPFSLPGELITARVYRNHKNYSEADLVNVVEASPHRIPSTCPLFGTCGGCQYQHLDYAEQLRWKQQQVHELLRHMAKLEFAVETVIASPVQMGYRSKITPHFHKPKNGQVAEIGFLRVGTRQSMIDVPQCPIAMPELNQELTVVRERVRSGQANYKNGATLLLRAAGNQVLTHPHDIAHEEVGGMKFEFQAGDFFQNNPFLLPAFVDYVVQEALATGAPNLIDAYCGSGLFGICAGRHFQHVLGVEVSETAIIKAKHNAALNALTNCEFIAADAGHLFGHITRPAADTVVILDPPRAGCGEDFLRQLFEFGPKAVVYVSCKPATQMRDLVLFQAAGYELRRVQPFDLFPQTKHLECVMTLSRTVIEC